MKSKSALLAATLLPLIIISGCSSATPAAQTVTETASPLPASTETVRSTVLRTVTAIETRKEEITRTETMKVTLPRVTRTLPAKTVRVTESATTAPAQSSVENGDYIIGKDIQPGIYQCNDAKDYTLWQISDRSNELLDGDVGTIARVDSSAYSAKLSDCGSPWVKVG